jgi:mannose-6-phosphate isomerase-like protein (cupin superfamily)
MTDATATAEPAARRTAAGEGDAYWFFDSLMVVRSGQPGQPVIIEATVAPGGGAPLHVHADLDDSFYLVSGGWPCAAASRPSP